jgi:hypothetical protein
MASTDEQVKVDEAHAAGEGGDRFGDPVLK